MKNQSSVSEIIIGSRIPKDYFITKGKGESDITIHAGSYHLALKEAGIEMCNIITYSSILPSIAKEVGRPKNLVHGSVMENISAVASAEKGKRVTAGIVFGWLYNKKTKKKFGGLVCEYNGNEKVSVAKESLYASLDELYTNGFSEEYELKKVKLITKSFIPKKRYGTAVVAICFLNYSCPIIKNK
ncbi:MAG TPA: pyruvoyl-dependent arginine decarboxylase [Candidatus Moranbacteria bacterium]|nr:pyruvoyl-dependent arginine decarboxylase [Candidatus Moranbacteria bacterium]